jgi:autotransporter-associated beta strand protein
VQNVATANGTVNLDGGTLAVTQVVKGGDLAMATFNFNGGTLRANTGAVGATFLQGITLANVRNGGAIIDTNSQDLTINQALQHSLLGGDAAKDGGLTKNGAGKLTLPGVYTYTGDTKVNGGVLSFGSAYLDDAATVSIASGAILDLTHAQTDIVGALTINGVAMPNGIYGAIGSGAPHENAAITGTGKIQVGVNQYESWADLHGLVGADRLTSADPDQDGLVNLLEYYLDGNPKAFTARPVPTAAATTVAINFQRRDDAEADMAAQVLQISTDLGTWTDVAIPAASGVVGEVSFTIAENGADADLITATVNKGTDLKKFLRIKVSE